MASQATCVQRRGRAGRTCPGTVYRLFSKAIYETLPVHPSPEVSRVDLSDLMLRLYTSGVKYLADLPLMTLPAVDHVHPMLGSFQTLSLMSTRGAIEELGYRTERTRMGYRWSLILNEASGNGTVNEIIGIVALLQVMENRLFSPREDAARRPQQRPDEFDGCLLYTSPSPRDKRQSRMPSSA